MAGKPLTYLACHTGPIPGRCRVQSALPRAPSCGRPEACLPTTQCEEAGDAPTNPKTLNQSMRRGCRCVSGTAHAGHAATCARHAPQNRKWLQGSATVSRRARRHSRHATATSSTLAPRHQGAVSDRGLAGTEGKLFLHMHGSGTKKHCAGLQRLCPRAHLVVASRLAECLLARAQLE